MTEQRSQNTTSLIVVSGCLIIINHLKQHDEEMVVVQILTNWISQTLNYEQKKDRLKKIVVKYLYSCNFGNITTNYCLL